MFFKIVQKNKTVKMCMSLRVRLGAQWVLPMVEYNTKIVRQHSLSILLCFLHWRARGGTMLMEGTLNKIPNDVWIEVNFSSNPCRNLRDFPFFFLQISKLIYTNAGNAILALASDAVHLLWKWQESGLNLSRMVTVSDFIYHRTLKH